MIHLLGAILLIAGGFLAGWIPIRQMGEYCRLVEQLISDISLMERELDWCAMPMPNLLKRLSEESEPPLTAFYASVCQGLSDGNGLEQSWNQALTDATIPIGDGEIRLLREAGAVLGRYDRQRQIEVLSGIARQLRTRLQELETKRSQSSRVCWALGGSGGVLAVLLLT